MENILKKSYKMFINGEWVNSSNGVMVKTYAPIDLDGIIKTLLTKEEKQQLNEYHSEVYKKLSPYLNKKEKEFLKEYTKNI